METKDKPNQETDPSVDTASEENSTTDVETSPEEQLGDHITKAYQDGKQEKEDLFQEVAEDTKGGSDSDVIPNDDSKGTDPNAEVLAFIETSTGRKFENVDDAKKYLSNLNSLVGDQEVAEFRKDSQLLNKLAEEYSTQKGIDPQKAKDELLDAIVKKNAPKEQPKEEPKKEAPKGTSLADLVKDLDFADKSSVGDLKKKIEALEHNDQVDQLLRKYPLAESVVEMVALMAKQKSTPYVEAFEKSDLKELIEIKAKEEENKPQVIPPSNRRGFDKQKAVELAKRVRTQHKPKDKVALTKAFLGDDFFK